MFKGVHANFSRSFIGWGISPVSLETLLSGDRGFPEFKTPLCHFQTRLPDGLFSYQKYQFG
jgi:hypothetical protein